MGFANLKTFTAHDSYVLDLRFTRDSQILISGGMDNACKLWSVPGWNLLKSIAAHTNSVNGIDLSPGEDILATCSSDKSVRLWSFPELELLQSLQDRKKVVANVRISPNGEYVCAASYGGRVAVWSLAGEPLAVFQAGERNMASLAISPDSSTLAVAGLGDEITLWELPSGNPISRLRGHEVAIMYLEFIQDGRYLVSLGQEGDIIFWDTQSWQQERVTTPDRPPRRIAFDRSAHLIALSMEGKIQIRRTADWRLVVEVKSGARVIPALAFSPDGHWFAAGAADKKIRVWEI